MDETCRWAQQVGRADVRDPPPSWGKHHRFVSHKLLRDFDFQIPEFKLAAFGEELGDWYSGAPFDLVVKVHERSAQPLRQRSPYCGFSSAREPNEDQVTIELTAGGVAHPTRSSSRAR